MKKMIKLGNVAVETRTNFNGNQPDGAGAIPFGAKCVLGQRTVGSDPVATITVTCP